MLSRLPCRPWGVLLAACVLAMMPVGCRSAGVPLHPPRLEPDRLASYDPAAVKRVALVSPRDFTPQGEAAVHIEDPLTGTLILTLRTHVGLEAVPGYLPDTAGFLTEVRKWYRGERGAPFPTATFATLRDSVAADAYLVVWIDRSSREWLTDESLQKVPGGLYRLEMTFLLYDPAGRLFWSVVDRQEVRPDSNVGLTVRTAVEKGMTHLERAFAGQENWQLGIQ